MKLEVDKKVKDEVRKYIKLLDENKVILNSVKAEQLLVDLKNAIVNSYVPFEEKYHDEIEKIQSSNSNNINKYCDLNILYLKHEDIYEKDFEAEKLFQELSKRITTLKLN